MTDQELTQNMKSQLWRINNLYWIINERGQKVKFCVNAVQYALFMTMWYLCIILKSRQHGITTFVCIFFLDTCLFNSNIHAGIIAHNREDAESFFKDKVKFAYDNLPETLRQANEAESESARELSFPNKSVIRVGTSMRSTTLQYLHISEFGKLCAKYPEKAREVVTGSLNTVHQGQFIIIESTAEGRSGYFYDYCMKALEQHKRKATLSMLDFKFFFFAWFDDPKNQSKTLVDIPQHLLIYFDELAEKGIKLTPQQKSWYVLKEQTQRDDMKREYPSTPEEAFEASARDCFFTGAVVGHTSFASGVYGRLITNRDKEVEFNEDPKGILQIWKYPYFMTASWNGIKWTHRYSIGSDIGEGLGGDWSTAYVFDRVLRVYVACMASNLIDSHRWGDRLNELSLFYENGLLVPERNGAGITTINRLLELKSNLYVKERVAEIGKVITKQYGWLETKEAKQSICGTLKSYLSAVADGTNRKKNAVYCAKLIEECSVFIKDEEKDILGADTGYHDDRVIGAALALAGDAYLPKPEEVKKPVTGWRKRQQEEREESGAWAA